MEVPRRVEHNLELYKTKTRIVRHDSGRTCEERTS